MPVITTHALTHTYSRGTPFEKTAIDAVDVEIGHGEFVGILGHTGSGKSTFIQHLNGLLAPTAGQVLIDGQDIHASRQATRDVRFKVGLVFQYPEYQLFEETVYKDISFGPRNMRLDQAEIDSRVRKAAQFAGVPEALFDQSPLELSGGQKRRVAIAGVLAMEPKVLVLDEPAAGLDPAGRESIFERIVDYHQHTGATILLVSHSMDDIARLATRLIVFSQGRIALDGTPHQIFSQAEALRQMGLTVPVATDIALALRKRGVNVPDGIYTIEQLHQALRTS